MCGIWSKSFGLGSRMNVRKADEEGDAVFMAPEHGREARVCQLFDLAKDGGVWTLSG